MYTYGTDALTDKLMDETREERAKWGDASAEVQIVSMPEQTEKPKSEHEYDEEYWIENKAFITNEIEKDLAKRGRPPACSRCGWHAMYEMDEFLLCLSCRDTLLAKPGR